jgi:hypothetical protein
MSCAFVVFDMPAGKLQATDNEAIPFNTITVMRIETCKIARRFHVGQHMVERLFS